MALRPGKAGKEQALQVEIETQEDWEENIAKEGLTVIDVYQEWCGPCRAMVANFKRMKNETGDELLRFAVAKADTVEALEKYRGKCEPCFVFYAGGIMVNVVRGANSPQIMRAIAEQLSYEHKVLEGGAERKEISDPKFPKVELKKSGSRVGMMNGEDDEEEDDEDDEDEVKGMRLGGELIVFDDLPEAVEGVLVDKMVTVAIIQPNVIADGKEDEVIHKIKTSGVEILERTERTLTDNEVRQFYASRKDEESFDEFVKVQTSGPSHIYILTKGEYGETVVEEWKEIMGPTSIAKAKETAPNSLRAVYGHDELEAANGFYGSESYDDAKRELAFFFPDFCMEKVTLIPVAQPKEERTLAIIRPDAYKEYVDQILPRIADKGFKTTMRREVEMTPEQVHNFFKAEKDEPYFDDLVKTMTRGPSLVLVLTAIENVVKSWLELLGPRFLDAAKADAPDCFRAQFEVYDVNCNQFHGSESEDVVENEISFFFPIEQTVAIVKPDAFKNKELIMHKLREASFRVPAQLDVDLTKEMAAKVFKHHSQSDNFLELLEHVTRGKSAFLVLSKCNAVEAWLSVMGPQDPEAAKTHAPNSIRALFGQSLLSNAVDGPTCDADVKEILELIFGEIQFDSQGAMTKRRKKKSAKKAQIEEPEADEQKPQKGESHEDDEHLLGERAPLEVDDQEERQEQEEGDGGEGSTPNKKQNDNEHGNEEHEKPDGDQEHSHEHEKTEGEHAEKEGDHEAGGGKDDEKPHGEHDQMEGEHQEPAQHDGNGGEQHEGEKEKHEGESTEEGKKDEGEDKRPPSGTKSAVSGTKTGSAAKSDADKKSANSGKVDPGKKVPSPAKKVEPPKKPMKK